MQNDPQEQTRRTSSTQPMKPVKSGDYYRPTSPDSMAQQQERGGGRRPTRSDAYRERSERARRPSTPRQNNGLYLPIWSVLLMLVVVIAAAVGVIALIVTAGGRRPDPGEPVVVIVTPEPSATPLPDATPLIAPSATVPPVQGAGATFEGPLPNFALEGPTLPPVVLSPTPIQITVGAAVIVDASDGLNIRDAAGLSTNILYRADDQTLFNVIDGPQLVDNLTWWRVQSPIDPTQGGWAAADYLRVQSPPG
jgi:hypothetical protein